MIYFIYTIEITDTDYLYVGSTKDYNRRVLSHKSNIKLDETHKAYNYKLYKIIRENGEAKCVYKIIENFECETKDEAKIREAYWLTELRPEFKKNDDSLNSIRPISFLTKSERDKEYHETHKEERKIYIENNREHIQQVAKEYYYNNQDKRLEIAKNYRKNNPDKIKEQNDKAANFAPIQCDCGMMYTYKHKARHMKSTKHQNLMLNISQN